MEFAAGRCGFGCYLVSFFFPLPVIVFFRFA